MLGADDLGEPEQSIHTCMAQQAAAGFSQKATSSMRIMFDAPMDIGKHISSKISDAMEGEGIDDDLDNDSQEKEEDVSE